MISPACHTRGWIEARRTALGAGDPLILERAIHALTLLDLLAGTGLDFVFKGGTALLLHLPHPQRLSIDIDVVCAAPRDDFESALESILPDGPFLRWDEQQRGERGLPGRRHYRFHYHSPIQDRESHVLLDVVTESNALLHLEEKAVTASFLEVVEPVSVKIPRLESLLADKLTAFAPTTIGVPLTEQFSQQVIKQVFDIAQLYDHVDDLAILAADNRNAFEVEARYSQFDGTYSDYLEDLIDAAFHICSLDLRGAPTDRDTEEQLLRRGIKQLGNHLLSAPFRLPQAKLAASKAACLAGLLRTDDLSTALPRFDPSRMDEIKDAEIAPPFSCLNRLKAFAPEIFFYWT